MGRNLTVCERTSPMDRPERQLWASFLLSLGAIYSNRDDYRMEVSQRQGILLFCSQFYPKGLDLCLEQ